MHYFLPTYKAAGNAPWVTGLPVLDDGMRKYLLRGFLNGVMILGCLAPLKPFETFQAAQHSIGAGHTRTYPVSLNLRKG